MSNLVNRALSRKFPVQDQLVDFPPYLTAKLGNGTSSTPMASLTYGVLRFEISGGHGSEGTRVRPAGKGTMRLELFDGFLRMDFDAPRTWEEAGGLPEPGFVRLTVRGIGQ